METADKRSLDILFILIIEELLKINEQQSNAIIKLQENQQPKYFLKPE